MDISTLSKQLNIPVSQLRAKMNASGFYVSPKANKIDNQMAKRVILAFSPKSALPVQTPGSKQISLPKVMRVSELASTLGLDVTTVIKKLIENGVMASINEEIDYDTAAIVASDLGFFEVDEVAETTAKLSLGYVAETIAEEQKSQAENFVSRPPIVAIMGHVDHGKTTLLDTIRKTKVAEGEAGRITQHIGAYSASHNGKTVTFLDTPGHEAFSAMRSRGANVTDIIVLVVAADDGVKPQTIEVINRAKLTGTPLIVAINKVDRPDANIERVKKELSDFGVLIEEWGGNVPVAKISALTGDGVNELMDLILLQAEVLELTANPLGATLGTVIESHLSRTQGPVATVLIQTGTLSVGDVVVVGKAFGKIRSMTDAMQHKVKTSGPSSAVQITGVSEVAETGDILKKCETMEEAKVTALSVVKSERAKKIKNSKRIDLGNKKELNLIIKVDFQGSLEAINESLNKLKNEEVKLTIIEASVGEINENDVLRAQGAKAIILGFHTKITVSANKLAQAKKVPVQIYDVIYELIEDITKEVVDMMTPEVIRTNLGVAKILAVFRTEKEKIIAGGTVTEGKLKDTAQIEIKRNDEIIGKAQFIELQQNRIKVKEVMRGYEFGASLKTTTKIEQGDVLICFEESVHKKTL